MIQLTMKHNLYPDNFLEEENKKLLKNVQIKSKLLTAGINLFRKSPNLTAPSLEEYAHSKTKLKPAALLIIPGGGYFSRDQKREAIPSASFFQANGIKTFILNYRVSPYPFTAGISDAQRAIQYLKFHANELGISANKVGVLGYSAGGHITSVIANIPYDGETEDELSRLNSIPDFHVLGYPIIDLNDKSPSLRFVRMMAFPKKKNHKIGITKLIVLNLCMKKHHLVLFGIQKKIRLSITHKVNYIFKH